MDWDKIYNVEANNITLVPIKFLAKLISGGTPDSNGEMYWSDSTGDGVPWISISDMSSSIEVTETKRKVTQEGIRKARLQVAPAGTVIFAIYASVGIAAITSVEATWNQAIIGFQVNKTKLLPKYLFYCLKFLNPYLPVLYRSNTQHNLSAEQVGNLKIPLRPLDEQQAIVNKLDREISEIDEFIADITKLQKLIGEREIAELEKNLIESASKFVELRRFKPRCISGTSVNAAPWQADDAEFGVLKTGVVSKGYFDPSQNKAVLEESEISRLSVPVKANTIIVNRANSPELVGSAAFVEKDYPNLFLSDKLWQIDFEDANNEHLAIFMQTQFFKEQVRQRCVGASSSMQNLSYQDFLSIKVPIISETRINSSNTKLLQINNNLVNLLFERKNILVGQLIEGLQR